MSRPTDAGNMGEAMYKQMSPMAYADEANGWALLIMLGSAGQCLEDLDQVVHSDNGDPPWSVAVDIDRVPDAWVPWLGQVVGVLVNTSLTVEQQKQQIRDHTGWGRGRPVSIVQAAAPFLTGTRTVDLAERDTSAYHMTASTYTDEEPADITEMVAAMKLAKAGALVLAHVSIPGSPANGTYDDIYESGETYDEIFNDYETYADVR